MAITGMGIVSAAGASLDEFRQRIEDGASGSRPAPHLPSLDRSASCGAWISDPALSANGRGRDPAWHLARRAIDEAARQAGLSPGTFPPGSALILGTTLAGAQRAQRWHAALLGGGRRRRGDCRQAPLHAIGDLLARRFGLDGPRTVVTNACASGTDALGLALEMVRSGEVEAAVAGGVDTLHAFNYVGFASLGALASGGACRPFDARREGMLLGEAAAFLVVEAEDSTRRRGAEPLAELAGYGASCDAVHVTAPDPAGGGARRAMRAALADAAVEPEDVDFVCVHGVGTRFADGMEAAALESLFGERGLAPPITSLRPMTGHTLGSVGAVDSIACVLSIQHGFIPPTLNHGQLDATLGSSLRVVRSLLRTPVRVALNSSSAFGGANAAIVIRRWSAAP